MYSIGSRQEHALLYMEHPSRPRAATVLVVDDYASVCELIATKLAAAGYRVFTALGGEDAQAMITKSPGLSIDLLITDIEMPRMRGEDLAAWLQRVQPTAKVLFMSTYKNDVRLNSPFAFLQKPFKPDSLTSMVQGLLTQC
jgi:two-component system, cell cycle sensor histidine kinase and response regulator CckA